MANGFPAAVLLLAAAYGGDASGGAPSGVTIATTCSAEAQARFDQGLFLLHSMMYTEARTEFAAAAKALEAMTREKVTVTQLPDAEVAKWAKASPDWYALIAKDLDGKGLPGTKIAKRYQALVKDYAEGRLK